jgi:hypothetical protein
VCPYTVIIAGFWSTVWAQPVAPWLAKLLNSHPDVFCYHEGVVSRVLPNRSYTQEDIFDFIDSLALNSTNGAYQAVGDVGSVWLGHIMNLARLQQPFCFVIPGGRIVRDLPRQLRVPAAIRTGGGICGQYW